MAFNKVDFPVLGRPKITTLQNFTLISSIVFRIRHILPVFLNINQLIANSDSLGKIKGLIKNN